MTVLVRKLNSLDRAALERHFLALGPDDRRLRFGVAFGDSALRGYVNRIDFADDAAFGVSNDGLELVGVAHLATRSDRAELGLSVLAGHRSQGVGGALMRRAHQHARNLGVSTMYIHCLAENAPVMHLARKLGMDIVAESSEAEAWLKLPPADALSRMESTLDERVALFDHQLKNQVAGVRHTVQMVTALLNPRRVLGNLP